MPYEIRITNDNTRVDTRYFGFLTTAEIYEAYEKRFTDRKMIEKYRLIVSDYSDVTGTDLGDVDVRSLAEVYKRASSHNANVIAVAIMSRTVLFGLGRMWEAYVDGISWKVRIVRTKEEAQSFIDECNASR